MVANRSIPRRLIPGRLIPLTFDTVSFNTPTFFSAYVWCPKKYFTGRHTAIGRCSDLFLNWELFGDILSWTALWRLSSDAWYPNVWYPDVWFRNVILPTFDPPIDYFYFTFFRMTVRSTFRKNTLHHSLKHCLKWVKPCFLRDVILTCALRLEKKHTIPS